MSRSKEYEGYFIFKNPVTEYIPQQDLKSVITFYFKYWDKAFIYSR